MSKSVDTRVVQMQFDNRQFEKNINETIASLEKLDESLQLKDVSKSFDKISQEAKEVNLSPLSEAVETVKVKFSALEVMAITALTNITNKAINAGERLVKSLSVDNIVSGWQKFEDTTTSVGTLISQGFSMEEVTEQLDKLNWFTDETSYNFTDMVNNIGKFTATGAKLDESVQAMMGIANWAALSGQNAQKASMAMYQLSQAMSKGVLKYDDWKSISNAAMDTREFREQAVQAALDVGTLKKETNGLLTTLKGHTVSINELFSSDYMSRDAWFTKDVMMNVFNKYSSAVNKLYEATNGLNAQYDTASEAIAAMGDQVDAFGLKAFRAAQEARTWTDVISSVKDAVSSKWKDTFELIVGNYKEAKKLFTALANLLYNVFAESGNRRNSILALWKEFDGREKLLDGLAAGFWAIKDAIDAVKQAFAEIFYFNDETGKLLTEEEQIAQKADKLVAITEKFRQTMYSIANFVRANSGNITSFFKGIFSVVKLITDGVTNLIHAILPVTSSINSFPQLILTILGAIGRLLIAFTEWIRESQILQTVLTGIQTVLKFLGNTIINIIVVIGLIARSIKTAVSNLMKLKPVQMIINAVTTGFMLLGAAIYTAYNAIKDFIIVVTHPALAAESNSPIVKTIAAIILFFKNLGLTVYNAVTNIKEFIGSLSGLSIGERFKALFNSIKEMKDNAVRKIFGEPEEGASSLLTVIQSLTTWLHNFFGEINIGTVIAIAFTASMIGVAGALAKLLNNASALFGNASGLLSTIRKIVTKTYAKSVGILNLAEAFGIIAASLFLLSKADPAKLQGAAIVMASILGTLTLMYVVVQGLSALLIKKKIFADFSQSMNNFGKTMTMLGASVLAIAGALLILQHVEFSGKLVANLAIAVVAVGALGAIGIMVSRFGKKGFTGLSGVATILALALSLNKIVKAISDLSELDADKVKETSLAIAPLILAFGALAAGIGQIKLGTIIGFLIVVKLLNKIIPEITQLMDNLDSSSGVITRIAKIFKSLFENAQFLAGLAAIIIFLGLKGKEIGSATKGISMLMLSIAGLLAFMVFLTKQKFEISGNILSAFFTIATFITMWIGLSQFTEKSRMLRFSAAMLLLTGSMYLMAGLLKVIDTLNISEDAMVPFIILGGIIALLEWAAQFTSGAKILSLLVIMGGLMSISTMLVVLSLQPWEKLVAAGGAMLLAFGGVALVIAAVAKLAKETSKTNITKSKGFFKRLGEAVIDLIRLVIPIAALVAAIYVIAKSINILRGMDWTQIAVGGAVILAIVGLIGLITYSLLELKLPKNNVVEASVALIVSLSVAIVSIGFALWLIKDVDWRQLLAATVPMLSVIIAISVAAGILGSLGSVTFIGLGALALGLAAVGGALAWYNYTFERFAKTLKELKQAAVGDPVGTLIKQITDSVTILNQNRDQILSDFYLTGQYMVEGLELGIRENLYRLDGLGMKMVLTVDDEAKKTSDQHSPGLEEKKIGANMVAGMALGIANGLQGLAKLGISLVKAWDNTTETAADVGEANITAGAVNTAATVEATAEVGMLNAVGTVATGVDAATELLDFSEDADNALSNVDRVVNTHATWWQKLLAGISTPVKFIANYLSPGYNGTEDFFDLWNRSYNEQLEFTTNDFAPTAEQRIGKVLENGAKIAGSAWDKIKEKFGISEGQDILDTLTQKAGTYKEELLKLLGINGEDSDIVNDLADSFSNLTSGIDGLGSSASKTKSTLESLKDTIKSQIDIFSKFEDQVEMIEEEVYDPETNTTSLVKREKTGAEMAEEMLANMESQIFGVTEWSNNMAKLAMMGMDEGLLQELGALGPKGASKVKAFVNMTSEQLQRANYLYATSVKLPDYAANEVASSYTYAGEMAIKGFSNALDQYAGIMNTYEIGEVAMEDISKAINETTVKVVAPQAKSSGKDTGKEYINGLSEGLDAEGPNSKLTSAAKRVAERANRIVRTTLQIHSPSRVAMKLGEFFTQGFAIGIGNKEEEAFDSASSMATAILNAVDSVTALMSTDSEFQPVLTPILDLSEIQNGAGELNTMFNNPQVAVASSAFNAKMEADRALIATQIENTRLLADAMQSNTDKVVDAIVNSNTPVNVNLTLQGDSAQLFKLVRQENAKFTKINGYNALAY